MSMAINYMDYGYYSGADVPTSVPVSTAKRTQVYLATHKGDERLGYRYRSFISFSFGGRNIEDFNLIATCDGDRMTRNLSADFEDLTSSTDVMDGQYYHGTHYKSNTLSLTLSTDGIDSRMLEDFKNWFRGGTVRPLILAEHPNREIMARISLPPELNMLPFEKEITMTIVKSEYKTSVTEYRGDIHLEFVMDEPFWYSIVNIFGRVEDLVYIDSWDGVLIFNGTADVLDALKDVLKMIYEDGIPISSMISEPMLLGDEIYAAEGNAIISSIARPCEIEELESAGATVTRNGNNEVTSITNIPNGYYINGGTKKEDNETYLYPRELDPDNLDAPPYHAYYCGAVIEQNNVTVGTKGTIFGPYIKSAAGVGLSFPPMENESNLNQFNLYYAGTAPAPVELSFTIPITILDDGSETNGYINTIGNSYIDKQHPYSSMFLRCLGEPQEMRFTTPNFFTSYNKAMSILKGTGIDGITWESVTWETLLGEIRDKVRHNIIREKLALIISNYRGDSITVGSTIDTIINNTQFIITGADTSLEVHINSKTGEASGIIHYCDLLYSGNSIILTAGTLEENIGDMISSNHLILEDRNYFNTDTYTIMSWKEDAPLNSYQLYHNFPVTLTGFSIRYKYLYY